MGRRSLRDAVVVITGASSGVGRATALEMARSGARLVLAARNEEALREVATECADRGAQALVVPTDTTRPAEVAAVAREALRTFGQIDVWVNDAAVTAFGRFDEVPYPVFRRVIDTNLLGYVHGARAVLPHFRRRGRGVLINVASVLGGVGQPYASAYVASKFAIRGLSHALRDELRGTDIHVCTVMPAAIDTPIYAHAANYTGHEPKPIPPALPARRVARAIVSLARRPRPERVVGHAGRLLLLANTLLPTAMARMFALTADRQQFSSRSAPDSPGNLFRPAGLARISGGYRRRSKARWGMGLLALAALPLAAAWVLGAEGRRGGGRKLRVPRRRRSPAAGLAARA